MIKKTLLGLGIAFLSFIGFSFGGEYNIVGRVGELSTSPLDNSFKFGVLNKGEVLTQTLGLSKSVVYPGGSPLMFFFWDTEGYPYIYGHRNYQGRPAYYSICNEITSSTTYINGCTSYSLTSIEFLNTFFSSITISDYYLIYGGFSSTSYSSLAICFSSSTIGNSVCFGGGNFMLDAYGVKVALVNGSSKNYAGGITFQDIPYGDIGHSPGFSGGGGDGGSSTTGDSASSIVNNNSAVDYFENNPGYKWNQSMCYVGTDDLSINYGGAGSFIYGQGKTIFDLYEYIYGSIDSVSNVGVWINSRLINYQQWFDNNGQVGSPTYLTNYSNGQVSVYYDNLTFPFAGKSSGLFFMASNLFDSTVYSQGNLGKEFATYCDIKLNGDNASPIDENSDYYRNIVNWEYFQNNNGNSYYDGSGNLVIYQKPSEDNFFNSDFFGYSGTGDYTDYFDGFRNFYNNLLSKFDNVGGYNTVGIIPSYILFFLALILLFKLFRH